MEQVYIWVKDIFLVIISLTFFQILIPDTKMDKYIRFIFSLVILAIIAEPVIVLVKGL